MKWHLPAAAPLLAAAIVLAGCAGTPPRSPPPAERSPPGPAPVTLPRPAPQLPPRPSDAQLLGLPDAVPRAEPRAKLGNPAFYEVFGQRYTVLASGRDYLERGVASWYGPDFHGVLTSTGEPYDMYSMTAAHRTLPLPSFARVTNLRNGRTIVVRLNDRGPFKANRIIDLSYAAALKLDMVRDGTTLVEVRALAPGGATAAEPRPTATELYAQAGAFDREDNARRLRDRLLDAGLERVQVRADAIAGRARYRVRVGPIDSVAAFDTVVARLHALGVAAVVLASN